MTQFAEGCKLCTKCGEMKGLSDYHSDKRRPDGRRSSCKVCFSRQLAAYKAANPEAARELSRKWAQSNREARRASQAAYAARNPDRPTWAGKNKEQHRQKVAKWRKENPDWVKAARDKRYRRLRDNPLYIVRSRIAGGLRNALRGTKQGRSWEHLVGYTAEDLRSHIERQFLKGMGWHNRGEWHIDHIVPLASFTITGPDDPELKRAWALANLRPLWATDNLHKSDKRLTLL